MRRESHSRRRRNEISDLSELTNVGHCLINEFNILQVIVFVCPSPASETQGKPHTELHLKSHGDILAYMGI